MEVGGNRGREALDRLRNVVGRVESSWRPATAEEGFEIVRRRLFEPLAEPDAVQGPRRGRARLRRPLSRAARRSSRPSAGTRDYEKRIKAAYPIHPEIFDRLYTDWSTLVKFQRTRGVLRLMAAVIHSLWEKGDRNPLILPATIPIDDPRVQSELTRYLSDNWVPIIEKDVDGPNSLPLQDRRRAAQPRQVRTRRRRVARTIYLGSAPTTAAAHRGLEDRRVKLGCVMPGESPAVFGDALRRLAAAATYLYQDGPRFWYSTQPTVTKLAEDRAEQLKRDPDKVVQELDERLRADLRKTGRLPPHPPAAAFGRRTCPTISTRGWSCCGIEHPYSKEPGSAAETAAQGDPRVARQHAAPLPQHAGLPRGRQGAPAGPRRGGAPVPGVGVDPGREGGAQPRPAPGEAGRDPEGSRRRRGDGAAAGDLPVAAGAGAGQRRRRRSRGRRSGSRAATRWPCGRARSSGATSLLVTTSLGSRSCACTWIDVPLWRGDHVAVKQLVEDFARYLYLPRLAGPEVLVAGDPRRAGAAHLGDGHVRLRRELRRRRGALPGLARRTGHVAVRRSMRRACW